MPSKTSPDICLVAIRARKRVMGGGKSRRVRIDDAIRILAAATQARVVANSLPDISRKRRSREACKHAWISRIDSRDSSVVAVDAERSEFPSSPRAALASLRATVNSRILRTAFQHLPP